MGQLTLELDEQTETFIRQSANNGGMSVNAWVIKILKTHSGWPAEVRALAGAWRDFPLAEELRNSPSQDIPREPF